MACRAPDATTTCAGTTPTGAQLAYDPAGQLTGWSGGTTTDSFLYDGEGNRVAQLATVSVETVRLVRALAAVVALPEPVTVEVAAN